MKKTIYLILTLMLWSSGMNANETSKQLIAYRTTIYTDSTLTDEISALSQQSRGFGSELLGALGNAAIGAATGYISSVVDLGIQAIGRLIMLDRKNREDWEAAVANECSFTTNIGTLYALDDFYQKGSDKGALDPRGMKFNGIGCMAMNGTDTSFYVSCHINRDKLNRILDHSKFELVLDTLVINPYRAHLPNTDLPLSFTFAQRKAFDFKMTIQLISSWMDFTPGLHTNEVLGEFKLDVPIDSTDVDKRGVFTYIRKENEPARFDIMGESFIVPRSYMQIETANGEIADHYGTGQYSLAITIEEHCDISQDYKNDWRQDSKMRKEMMKAKQEKKSFDDVCRTISRQTWDESLQAWVITILKAPADYSIKTLNEYIAIPTDKSKASK